MARPGPAPRPPLQVVREGNPSKRPVREGVKMPLVEHLAEPEWLDLFPDEKVPQRPRKPKDVGDEKAMDRYLSALYAWQRLADAIESSNRCRVKAQTEWRRVVPLLARTAGLADVDRTVVLDYCIATARLWECERRISVEGLVVMGQRGECRNPLTTVASQYRTQLKAYIGELGLSPSARGRIDVPGSDDDDGDDAFD